MFVSAEELRGKSLEQLEKELFSLESTYMNLRQQAHSKTAEREDVREARKNVARCKTVIRELKLKAIVEQYKGQEKLPKELRPRLTKSLRMKLTPAQKNKKTKSQMISARKYPLKIFSYKN